MSGQWSTMSPISPAINTLEEVIDNIVLPHLVQPVHSSAVSTSQGSAATTRTVTSMPVSCPMGVPSTPKIEKLKNDNWFSWEARISIVLKCYGALEVATGMLPKPSDPKGTATVYGQIKILLLRA